MTTKRATLLAITALPKVSSSRNNSFALLKNLSTATQPSSSDGDNHVENSSQNPNGFYNDSNQNSVDFQHKPSFNPIVSSRENPGNEIHHNSVGQNGSFGGYYGPSYGEPNPNGFYRENRNMHNTVGSYNVGIGEVQQSQNGSYGHNTAGMNGNYSENIDQFQKSQTDNYNNVGKYQQHSGEYSRGNNEGHRQSPDGNVVHNSNSNNFGQYQHTQSVYNTVNTANYQQNEYVGGYQRSSNEYYGQNAGEYQHVNNNNNNVGQFQQSTGSYYNGSTGLYQQSHPRYANGNVGEYRQSTNGYYGEYGGHYQKNINGNASNNFVSQFQQSSSELQNASVVSQVSSNLNPDGDSVEATEGNQYRGTLEELDSLCKEGKVKEAVEVLKLIEQQGIIVDLPQYLRLMHACGEAKALEEAKAVHKYIIGSVSPLKVSTYNKILEMYSRCGSMDNAYEVFNMMPTRNLTSWDTMITWLTKNDLADDAIDLFNQLKKTEVKLDGQLFIGIFSACSVLSEIEEGMLHFETMSKVYGIVPSMKHYLSVVDMLGSSGYLDEAFEFIENLPIEPSLDIWETLMNLCRIQGNLELGDRCAEILLQLDPSRLTEQSKAGLIPVKASDIVKEKEKKKLAGQNLLEVKSRVHEYRAGDTSHPENEKIYTQLRGLRQQMKEAGYVAETRFVLHDIDQEGKEEALLAHSERLAVSYGLFSSPARSPIRVIKNLRVCGYSLCAMLSDFIILKMGHALAMIIGKHDEIRGLRFQSYQRKISRKTDPMRIIVQRRFFSLLRLFLLGGSLFFFLVLTDCSLLLVLWGSEYRALRSVFLLSIYLRTPCPLLFLV